MLDGVSMPGTFYIVYLGFEDASLMTAIQRAYQRAHPSTHKAARRHVQETNG